MFRRRVLSLARRRRRWLLWAGAAAGCCLIYRHPAVASRRRRLARLASALASLADAAALVASDLAGFLRSDSDAVPQTLKQISKLAASPEASASASALSGALAAGVLRGYYAAAAPGSGPGAAPGTDGAAFSDRVLDRLLSPDGERLASAVTGSFGRHLVLAFYSAPSQPATADATTESWVDALTTRRCQRAIRSWVEVFTATAVGVFIDKTIHINTYDQLFAAATNPAYGARLQELFVALCSASVETLVKTSHGVLSSANSTGGNANASANSGSDGGVGEGWIETVSSAMAVPSNRKLALDLTGRATFEAVRSFLEFVLWKLHAGVRAGGDATVGAGLHALRHMSYRSMVVSSLSVHSSDLREAHLNLRHTDCDEPTVHVNLCAGQSLRGRPGKKFTIQGFVRTQKLEELWRLAEISHDVVAVMTNQILRSMLHDLS
ncbi:Protein PHLOEM PROTEIN 2-LIKE A10 [Dichanthelium oligosanthes]|uniref:Protein PHLOEM PROTEIN 2-LIKE A10 n=1 Tax=Dichanthelium oligosanthes TaxID=888268 RepID=A0A1E5VTZ3_9POAL|nr:Protein PHLOEM PROTEIN 2-LIKE A10 [Dichanthelium oligosanthes]